MVLIATRKAKVPTSSAKAARLRVREQEKTERGPGFGEPEGE